MFESVNVLINGPKFVLLLKIISGIKQNEVNFKNK